MQPGTYPTSPGRRLGHSTRPGIERRKDKRIVSANNFPRASTSTADLTLLSYQLPLPIRHPPSVLLFITTQLWMTLRIKPENEMTYIKHMRKTRPWLFPSATLPPFISPCQPSPRLAPKQHTFNALSGYHSLIKPYPNIHHE